MHRARAGRDRGSVTAEFAIVLPALLVLLVVCAGVLGATGSRIRLEDAAADAARIVARGEPEGRASSIVAAAVDGARAGVSRSDGLVCVTARAVVRIAGVASVPVSATSCALDGGW